MKDRNSLKVVEKEMKRIILTVNVLVFNYTSRDWYHSDGAVPPWLLGLALILTPLLLQVFSIMATDTNVVKLTQIAYPLILLFMTRSNSFICLISLISICFSTASVKVIVLSDSCSVFWAFVEYILEPK